MDAFAYIAVVHADGIISLPKVVLAEVLGLDQSQVRRYVIGPLGEEAAATLAGNFVITRHRYIARTALGLLPSKEYDPDELYRHLARAAWAAPSAGNPVVNRGEWLRLPRKLYQMGREAIGLQLARDLYGFDRTDSYFVVTLATLLRDAGQASESVEIFRGAAKGLRKDRVFYHEWGVSEGNLGRFGIDVWLAGIALADGIEGALDFRTVRLAGLVIPLLRLCENSAAQVFIEAVGAATQLGLRLPTLGDRERELLRRGLTESQRAGISEVDIATAIKRLQAGIVAGCKRKEAEMPFWVPDAEDLIFNELARLFGIEIL